MTNRRDFLKTSAGVLALGSTGLAAEALASPVTPPKTWRARLRHAIRTLNGSAVLDSIGGGYRFETAAYPVVLPGGGAVWRPWTTIHVTADLGRRAPVDAFREIVGGTNDRDFCGAPRGTLTLAAVSTMRIAAEPPGFAAEMEFGYDRAGWNSFMRPDGAFAEVCFLGGSSPFPYTDFGRLP